VNGAPCFDPKTKSPREGLLLQLHASTNVALAAGVVAAAALLAGTWVAGDLGGFTLAACAAIILAPVAWIGYMGILVIPLAVASPRWSRAWLLLAGTYISWYHSPLPYKSAPLSVCTLLLGAAIVVAVLRVNNQSNSAETWARPPALARG
jgi:hypothetical protein